MHSLRRLLDRCRFLARTFFYRLQQAAPGYEEIVDHGDCHDVTIEGLGFRWLNRQEPPAGWAPPRGTKTRCSRP